MNLKFNKIVLALGAESSGNFSVYKNGEIYHSDDFGDLLNERNFENYKNELFKYLKDNNVKPDMVVTDLHPLYRTTELGKELAREYEAELRQVQHHLAHIFSAIGEHCHCEEERQRRRDNLEIASHSLAMTGVAMDGTGYGEDGKIWGSEIFKIKIKNLKIKNIERIGHLEEQTLIGGELAVREPARVLIGVLSKFLKKEDVFGFVGKYYNENQFELLYNQMKQGFNCIETSSTGRVLDAVSVLLGFSENERDRKHGPTYLLEENSGEAYDILPKLVTCLYSLDGCNSKLILDTTYLFKYIVNELEKDDSLENRKRLGATAQLYIARGLYEIVNSSIDQDGESRALCQQRDPSTSPPAGGFAQDDRGVFIAGGMADNKIISSYLESKGAIANKKVPRGDAGLSFGQIVYSILL